MLIENKKENWKFEFNSSFTGEMQFSYDNQTILKSSGVKLGILEEKQGIENIYRNHTQKKTSWQWVETETTIPFASEPVIKRKYEQAGNHIRVVTDITNHNALSINKVVIDSLQIPNNWSKISIIALDLKNKTQLTTKEINVKDYPNNTIKLDSFPLILLFSGGSETELEIGIGYDLWRWNIAQNFNATPEFIINIQNDCISIDRTVLKWETDYLLPRNNFRFNWYFSWGKKNSEKGEKIVNNTKNFVYQLDEILPPDLKKHLCFSSRYLDNFLRAWVRGLPNKLNKPESDIYLLGLNSNICLNASHLGKNQSKKLIHWDYPYILGFWEWANNFLSDKGLNFHVGIKTNSSLADFPSAKGLLSNCVH